MIDLPFPDGHHPPRGAALDVELRAEERADQIYGIGAQILGRIADDRDRLVDLRRGIRQLDRCRIEGVHTQKRHVGFTRSRNPEDLSDLRRPGQVARRVDLLERVQPDLDEPSELAVLELPLIVHPALGEETGHVAVGDHDILVDQPAGPGVLAKTVEQVQPPRGPRPLLGLLLLGLEQVFVAVVEVHVFHHA